MKLKVNSEFIKREIAGECFLVPIGEAAKKFSGLFALNPLGAFLWDRLPEAEDEAALLRAILEEYEVTEEAASADLAEFLEKLRSYDII